MKIQNIRNGWDLIQTKTFWKIILYGLLVLASFVLFAIGVYAILGL